MKKIIILLSIVLIISKSAFAGGESTAYLYFDDYTKCGNVLGDGNRFLQSGESCEVGVWFATNYFYRKRRPVRYWLERREVGGRSYKRFSRTRVYYPNPKKYEYSSEAEIKFRFATTAQYQVCLDYNDNGYPEYCSNYIWLFEKQ